MPLLNTTFGDVISMNIVYISPYPPTRHGVGSYTNYLYRALSRIDKEIKVQVVADKATSTIKTRKFEVVPCFDMCEASEAKVEYAEKITEAALKFWPDVVHIQQAFSIFCPDERFLNLLEELIKKRKKSKIVLTIHTVHTNETSDWEGMNMSMEEYNYRMSRLCDGIIVHQGSMKKSLIRQGVNEELIHVIPHGTEILETVDKAEARKGLGLPEDGKIILSFGFLSKYKNRELIFEALPFVLEQIPNAYVFFSAYVRDWVQKDFEYRKLYEEKAKEFCVRDQVIFADRFIPNEEIHLAFSASDVVVFSYRQKNLSASGVLHLAIGSFKPVVVSRIPKFEEVPQRISQELVFDSDDSSEMAKILVRLMLDNNYREAIIEKVKSYALKTSWDAVAALHMQIYRSL